MTAKILLPFFCATLLAGCALPVREVRIPVREFDPASVATHTVLAYQDHIRPMNNSELAKEASKLSEAPTTPLSNLQLALVLVQSHSNGDLLRAISLLEKLNADARPEAQLYQPLARLVLGMLSEQRKLEEQLERQGQQQREQQKKLDQLNEKLEALKAIERNLPARPAPATPGSKP